MGKGKPPRPSSSDIETGEAHHHRHPPTSSFSPPIPEPWCSWLVPLIFVANIAMFVHSMYINNCPAKTSADKCLFYEHLGRYSFQPVKENPLFGPSYTTLRQLGALDWTLVVQHKQTWRLISCIWLHAGIIHLAANMMSLVFIGIRQEEEFGFFKIGLLYMLSGFGGSLMSALAAAGRKGTISVGASGALFGLLGAMLSELITNWSTYRNKCAALFTLLLIIILNLAIGFLPNVDNSAHIGGFISGFLLGFILLMRPQYGYVSPKHIPPGYQMKHKKAKHKWYQYVFCIIALVILIFGYSTGWEKLLKGERYELKLVSSMH